MNELIKILKKDIKSAKLDRECWDENTEYYMIISVVIGTLELVLIDIKNLQKLNK
jgi:hypothetical protein